MITKIDSSLIYTSDILQILFQKSMVSPTFPQYVQDTVTDIDYLHDVQGGMITDEDREKLHTWIFNVTIC